jgi:hypothetical protein
VHSDEHGERLYRLIIQWQQWRHQLRTLFVKEVETRRQATNRRYDAPDRDRSRTFKSDIIIYFLGQQVEASPTDFEVNDFRKVAIVVEPNGIYSDYPNHSFLKRTPSPEPPKAKPTEPPSWVTDEFDDWTLEPKKPDPPPTPRPPVPRPVAPVVTTNYERRIPVNNPPPAPRPYYPPEPKPRGGFLEWLKSFFE